MSGRSGLACGLVIGLAASGAGAADRELSLTGGIRFGGEVEYVETDRSAGLDGRGGFTLAFGRALGRDRWLEVLWSRESSEFEISGLFPTSDAFGVDIDDLHLAGVYRPARAGGPRPFVLFGVGLTRFEPEPSGFDDDLGGSLIIGGGARVALHRRLDLRLEGRGHVTFTDATLTGSCGGASCSFEFEGGGMFRFELAAGLSLGF